MLVCNNRRCTGYIFFHWHMNPKPNHICPLCGGPNECTLAQSGSLNTPCWCREVTINPEAVARAKGGLLKEHCICKQCAAATTSDTEIPATETRLYSTLFCHLCEEAVAIIHKAGVTTTPVDIADNDGLFEKYSKRIPVLRRVDTDAELDWPFDAVSVSRFLA